uniref:Uncharacterized protein n=1 Tax=Panagrellus redivivus TaxID=6233 RepID=A0A7E4ZWZ4_PANRE
MNLLVLWVSLSVAALLIICGLSSSPHESKTTILVANRKNRTKDRLFRDNYYIVIKGEFRCFGQPYVGPTDFLNKVYFYEDDNFGADDLGWVELENGTLDATYMDNDDIFHPWLEVYVRLGFNCSCLESYESLTSPRTRQSRNLTLAQEVPFYLGIIELTHVCKYPHLYRKHASLNHTEFPNIDDPYANHNFSKIRK